MALTWEYWQRWLSYSKTEKKNKNLMSFPYNGKCPGKIVASRYLKISLIKCGLLHNRSISFGSGRKKAELFSQL